MCVIGLGAFEYFQLAEELSAEPVWVINNGISHTYSVPADQIWPLVQVTPAHSDPPQLSIATVLPVYGIYINYYINLYKLDINLYIKKLLSAAYIPAVTLQFNMFMFTIYRQNW